MSESLTFDKLLEIAESLTPVPFVGYTCNSSGYQKLKAEFQPIIKEVESDFPAGRDCIGGIAVFQVQQQEKDIIQWEDKNLMIQYVKKMDELLRATASPFAPKK